MSTLVERMWKRAERAAHNYRFALGNATCEERTAEAERDSREANEDAAAVAELIEADHRFDRASRAWFDAKYFPGQFSKPETQRLAEEYEDAIASRRAALARVGPSP